jgi:hypothetical protein
VGWFSRTHRGGVPPRKVTSRVDFDPFLGVLGGVFRGILWTLTVTRGKIDEIVVLGAQSGVPGGLILRILATIFPRRRGSGGLTFFFGQKGGFWGQNPPFLGVKIPVF